MSTSDAQIDHLSAAVDRAFAERDRLDDVARRTGRDEDLAAMLRQDEHAARLLDQYNAAVAAQMAEVDRRRAENIEQQWLREADDEDLKHETLNTGQLLEIAEDDGDTEKAERLRASYAAHLAEQERRANQAGPWTDSDDEQGIPWRDTARWQEPADDSMSRDASRDTFNPPPTAEPHTPRHLEMKRTGRWYDTNPITSTNTTPTGGAGMSIRDAKLEMLGPIEKLNEALGSIQAGHAAAEEAQSGLQQATEGSNQAEADQAHAQVAESLAKIDEAKQQIASAIQEFEAVAARL